MTKIESAYIDLAKAYESSEKYEKAFNCYIKIEGNADCYEKLGELFYEGLGCKQDIEQAKIYFKKAADLDNVDAMCNYARCTSDNVEKILYYKKASNAGNGYAMYMVGKTIEDNNLQIGESSYDWYVMSAETGEELAINKLAMMK